MAKKEKHAGRRWKLATTIGCTVLIVFLLLYMYVSALVVHLRRAEVYISDLPRVFDGTTVLFISDVETSLLDPPWNIDVNALSDLNADIVLLGGNYASPSFFDVITDPNASGNGKRRQETLSRLSRIESNEGIYAVTGNDDGTPDMLWHECEGTGIQVLNNTGAIIKKEGESIYIAGISPDGDIDKLASMVDSDMCVIAFANDPSRALDINVSDSRNGGQWIDLLLSGHNLGGQVVIAGKTMMNLNESQQRYFKGWYMDKMPILVSQGFGCRGIDLRFGSQAEIWLITLKCL